MTVADPAGDAPAAGDRDGLPRRGFRRLAEQGPGLLEGPVPSQSPCLQPLTPVRAHLRQAMTSSSYAGNLRFGYLMIWQTSTLDWTTGWRCEDADGGDDCTRSTGAREGQERSGDCPVAEVVVGNGGQVFALGRDCTAVRAAGSALSTAGGIPEGSGAAGGGERPPAGA